MQAQNERHNQALTEAQQLSKLCHLEQRAMGENIHPHEIVRQIMLAYEQYNPEMDKCWAVRKIRDIILDYMRILSGRYPHLSSLEKKYLCQLTLFESGRRYISYVEPADRERYRMTVRMNEAIEQAEASIMHEARLYPINALRPENLEDYNMCEAYDQLRRKASSESMFEMSTILTERYNAVHEATENVLIAWRANEAALTQPEPTTQRTQDGNISQPSQAVQDSQMMT